MLVAAINVGRLRIVSGNPSTGASGKPELALIINSEQGTNAETAGTVGFAKYFILPMIISILYPHQGLERIGLQTLTDEDIIKKAKFYSKWGLG